MLHLLTWVFLLQVSLWHLHFTQVKIVVKFKNEKIEKPSSLDLSQDDFI